MRRVNYKSDFDFVLRLWTVLTDSGGAETERRELLWPEYDWTAVLWTGSRANGYTVGCYGGVPLNCYEDGGRIHVVVDGHRMGPGELRVEFRAELPREVYPDGYQRNVVPEPLGIVLTAGRGDVPTEMEAELLLPYIKGDKGDKGDKGEKGDKGDSFTYADFTAEEIAELQRPAADATADAEAAAVRANDAARKATDAADGIAGELEKKADRTELSNIVGIPAEEGMENIDSTLVTTVVRTVPQTLTPEEQATVKENIGVSKMELFCDLLNAAAGDYGYARIVNGVFDCELNKVKLTYDEAVDVYLDGTFDSLASAGKKFRHRTNLPITSYHLQDTVAHSFDSDNFVMNVEIANVASLNSSAYFSAYPISIYHKPFSYAKLKKIIGIIDFHFARARINWFVGAVNLEEVDIYRLAYSIDLRGCSKLNLQSFQTMIVKANSDADSGIHPRIITVHPDVYARLTDESNTEWCQVLLDAADKNITFATV